MNQLANSNSKKSNVFELNKQRQGFIPSQNSACFLKTSRSFLKLDTVDIVGAQPQKLVKDFVNWPDSLGQNYDIDKSSPGAQHIGLYKPEYNLTNSDIEKSKPNYIKFQTTHQIPPSNTLNPVYKLAEVVHIPLTPFKFIRDQINNDDVDGAHPKKQNIMKLET